MVRIIRPVTAATKKPSKDILIPFEEVVELLENIDELNGVDIKQGESETGNVALVVGDYIFTFGAEPSA